jgi:hypothetical protein
MSIKFLIYFICLLVVSSDFACKANEEASLELSSELTASSSQLSNLLINQEQPSDESHADLLRQLDSIERIFAQLNRMNSFELGEYSFELGEFDVVYINI